MLREGGNVHLLERRKEKGVPRFALVMLMLLQGAAEEECGFFVEGGVSPKLPQSEVVCHLFLFGLR